MQQSAKRPQHMRIDDRTIEFTPGQTIIQAAAAAGVYIPHLCHHPDYPAQGNCKLCTVKSGNRYVCACTTPAEAQMQIDNVGDEITAMRRSLIQLLFVEGNHHCPACERSGSCRLQALAYELDMHDSHFSHSYPQRRLDASHPEVLLDADRCILCGLCVRASEAEGANVFAIGGRGAGTELIVRSDSGLLGDSDLQGSDKAAHICPTGALMIRGEGFGVPIGERLYDHTGIAQAAEVRPGAGSETGAARSGEADRNGR